MLDEEANDFPLATRYLVGRVGEEYSARSEGRNEKRGKTISEGIKCCTAAPCTSPPKSILTLPELFS